MGKHYVTREYLKGFQIMDRPGFIWMYDRQHRRWSEAAISRVAQEPGYYSENVEQWLTRNIDGPGHRALNRVRVGEPFQKGDREALAVFMAAAYSRVPKLAKRKVEMTPEMLPSTLDRIRGEFRAMTETLGIDRVNAFMGELDRVEAEYAEKLPEDYLQQLRHPHISARAVEALFRMTWRLVPAHPDQPLITTDAPLFFFASLGIAAEEAEITFPLSHDRALVGSHRGIPAATIEIDRSSRSLIRALNRRMISGSDRFIFSQAPYSWVETLCSKPSLQLGLIRW